MDRKLVVAGMAALALAVASCGSTGSAPLTRAELAKQAGAICAHRKAAFAAVERRQTGDIKQAIRAAFPALKQSVEQLGELRPPAALRRSFDEILAVERHQVAISEDVMRTGRIPPGATEDGPPLHRHEHMREAMGMAACNL